MAWTQSDLDELDAVILLVAKGGKSVTYADRSYTAHDLGELMELRAKVAADVAATSGAGNYARAGFGRE